MIQTSVVLPYWLLDQWAQDASVENFIIGTGALAKEMRRVLQLLDLKVPFLLGMQDDPEQGIRHYSAVETIEAPKQCRFLICCQEEERELLFVALIPVYRLLGSATWNHPQVIRFGTDDMIFAHEGGKWVDAARCNIMLREGNPYTVYGDVPGEERFHIHILGSCHAATIGTHTAKTFPDQLFGQLEHAGFATTIYTWGQLQSPVSDTIMGLLRDGVFHKMDLVILFVGSMELDPFYFPEKNMLSVRTGTAELHPLVCQLRGTYAGEISNGVNHDASLHEIRVAQNKVFQALSKQYGFAFWDIIGPMGPILPEAQALRLRGLSRAYYARRRAQKDALVKELRDAGIKDYSDTFADVEDIFSMFVDSRHFSDEGCRLLAERCARDILAAFGPEAQKRKGEA